MTTYYEIRNKDELYPWPGGIAFSTMQEAVDYLLDIVEPGTWTIRRVEERLVARRVVEDNEQWQAQVRAVQERFEDAMKHYG